MREWRHLYVVFRVDPESLASDLTRERGRTSPHWAGLKIKEILRTEEEAVAEVERLNALNGHKGCEYEFQSAKFYPDGR